MKAYRQQDLPQQQAPSDQGYPVDHGHGNQAVLQAMRARQAATAQAVMPAELAEATLQDAFDDNHFEY